MNYKSVKVIIEDPIIDSFNYHDDDDYLLQNLRDGITVKTQKELYRELLKQHNLKERDVDGDYQVTDFGELRTKGVTDLITMENLTFVSGVDFLEVEFLLEE